MNSFNLIGHFFKKIDLKLEAKCLLLTSKYSVKNEHRAIIIVNHNYKKVDTLNTEAVFTFHKSVGVVTLS